MAKPFEKTESIVSEEGEKGDPKTSDQDESPAQGNTLQRISLQELEPDALLLKIVGIDESLEFGRQELVDWMKEQVRKYDSPDLSLVEMRVLDSLDNYFEVLKILLSSRRNRDVQDG